MRRTMKPRENQAGWDSRGRALGSAAECGGSSRTGRPLTFEVIALVTSAGVRATGRRRADWPRGGRLSRARQARGAPDIEKLIIII